MTLPWDQLKENEERLRKLPKSTVLGVIEKGATIKGFIILGRGSIILPGVYIEGPVEIGKKSLIGPNCYLRPGTKIGNNVKIGQAVEIKNSVIGDETHIAHLSYVGDSVIEENVNLGAGTITANLRHDGKNIKVMYNNKLVDTKRRKFGAWIKKGVKTGIHTSIYPGVIISSGVKTLPGDIIKRNI